MSCTSWACAVGVALLSGCGDAKTSGDEWSGSDHFFPPEADVDAQIHIDYGSDEGGEVRLEHIQFPNGSRGARGTAFFYANSGTTKFFNYPSLDGCTIVSSRNVWPFGQNPVNERFYYDAGPYVNVSGGAAPFVIAKSSTGGPSVDSLGRTQLANDWYWDPAGNTDTDGDSLLPADTNYSVTLPGSQTYLGGSYDQAVYMPASWTIVSPAFGPTLSLPAGTSQTFVFGNAINHPPAGVVVRDVVVFTGPMGAVAVCIKQATDGANTSIEVPASVIDLVRATYPTIMQGQILRQTMAHQVRSLLDQNGAPTNRRIDFLGVWCYAGQAIVTD